MFAQERITTTFATANARLINSKIRSAASNYSGNQLRRSNPQWQTQPASWGREREASLLIAKINPALPFIEAALEHL